uniref:Uncharacterized protein n=1 Tax=Hucho hucho TaxID=62062 RepID=A0A4W5PBJ7_9TELE
PGACSLLATSQRSPGSPHSTAVGRLWWIYMQVRKYMKRTGDMLHIHQNVTSPPHDITDCDSSSVPVMERVDISGEDQEEVSPKRSDREVWGAWTKDTAIHIASLLQDITGGPWKTGVQHIEHVKSYTPHIHHIVLFLKCRPL